MPQVMLTKKTFRKIDRIAKTTRKPKAKVIEMALENLYHLPQLTERVNSAALRRPFLVEDIGGAVRSISDFWELPKGVSEEDLIRWLVWIWENSPKPVLYELARHTGNCTIVEE